MQTICNLRDREKTWYGGDSKLWLSSPIEDEGGVGNCLLSWGETLGLDVTEFAMEIVCFLGEL